MSILDVRGLSAGYENGFVIHDISLAVEAGEFVAILGRNGSGKSTLIKAVQNLLDNVRGTVLCGGESVFRMGPRRLASKIAYVPQLAEPIFEYTAEEIVLMGRFARQGRFERASARGRGGRGRGPAPDRGRGLRSEAAFAAERRRAAEGLHRPGPGPGHALAAARRAQPAPRYQLPGRSLRHPQGPPAATGKDRHRGRAQHQPGGGLRGTAGLSQGRRCRRRGYARGDGHGREHPGDLRRRRRHPRERPDGPARDIAGRSGTRKGL